MWILRARVPRNPSPTTLLIGLMIAPTVTPRRREVSPRRRSRSSRIPWWPATAIGPTPIGGARSTCASSSFARGGRR